MLHLNPLQLYDLYNEIFVTTSKVHYLCCLYDIHDMLPPCSHLAQLHIFFVSFYGTQGVNT